MNEQTQEALDGIERATRAFLTHMAREAAKRRPVGFPNPVPMYDELQRSDQLVLLGAIAAAGRAAAARPETV